MPCWASWSAPRRPSWQAPSPAAVSRRCGRADRVGGGPSIRTSRRSRRSPCGRQSKRTSTAGCACCSTASRPADREAPLADRVPALLLLADVVAGQLRDVVGQRTRATSARLVSSSTDRMLARNARHTSVSAAVGPEYGRSPSPMSRTLASGPSMQRNTSATLISAAGRASSSAVAAPVAADQPVGAQLGQDVDQKLGRDALGFRQVVGLDQDVGVHGRELHHRPNGVLRLGRHPHVGHISGHAADGSDLAKPGRYAICVACRHRTNRGRIAIAGGSGARSTVRRSATVIGTTPGPGAGRDVVVGIVGPARADLQRPVISTRSASAVPGSPRVRFRLLARSSATRPGMNASVRDSR